MGVARLRLGASLLVVGGLTVAAAPPTQLTTADYDRSALFLPWNKTRLILDDDIEATWIGRSERVWFKTSSGPGWRFMVADTVGGGARPAFDHARIAAALTGASGGPVDAARIAATALDWPAGPDGPVRLTIGPKVWECAAACRDVSPPPRNPSRAWSADGRTAIAFRDYDLVAIDHATGAERRLTDDGTRERPYAAVAGIGAPVSRVELGAPAAPIGEFSPNGRTFLTYRLDESRAPERVLVRHAPPGASTPPQAITFRAAWSGDPPTTARLILIDLVTGKVTPVDHPPTRAALIAPVALTEVRWTADSRFAYFTDYADLFHERALFRVEAATGRTERLIVERAATNQYSFLTPVFELLADGGVLWPSERTGWQQLYRYSREGKLLNPVTRGTFVAREITAVDEARGMVTFSAGGREAGDPYLRRLYRAPLAGGSLRLLTPENADHNVRIASPQLARLGGRGTAPPAFSSSGRYFLDSYSRVDLPTQTVVRRSSDGRIVRVLATARHAPGVPEFATPEPFEALAADRVTPVYGLLVKPRGFDPGRRYPVIDSMYAGPQSIYVPKTFGGELIGPYGRGLAELGFVVFMVDGRGLPLRSRAYQDASYGRLQTAGFLDDHVAALRQVAATRPWMDLGRVGAFGLSAGGYAVVRAMLDHGDVYKVGVATSPYDPMHNDSVWQERYQGSAAVVDVLPAVLSSGAERLRGDLLVLHGDVDDVASPAGTLRLTDAVVRANKRFEMMIVPNAGHQLALHPYALGRQWDFFVTHLLGATPPPDYDFTPKNAGAR